MVLTFMFGPVKILGSDTILSRCLLTPTFGEFLKSIVSQTELISSDADFLPSFFTSMLSTSGHSLLVSEDINKRSYLTSHLFL